MAYKIKTHLADFLLVGYTSFFIPHNNMAFFYLDSVLK